MPDHIVIRDLETADIEAVVDIALAAWEPIYAQFRKTLGDELFAAAYPGWRKEKARQVRAACEPDDRATVCVAEKDGQVVGFVTFYADGASGIGAIGNNAVHPDFQGQGIGTRLYEHVFGRLRELGMRFVKVHTGLDPSHAAARRAYEKVGFTIQLPNVRYYRKL